MNIFSELLPKNLYHTYIIEGENTDVAQSLIEELESRGDVQKQSPDFLYQVYDSFTVGDSVKIKEWHSERGLNGKKRICIISTKFINHDAEQTLLKILEEPGSSTHFFIVLPNASVLLETIKSRAHILKIEKNNIDTKYSENFIKVSIPERLKIIEEIIEKNKDNENSGGLRHEAISLINDIEKIIYKKWKLDKNTNLSFILEELSKSREYLSIPGSSVKMILENIAIVI